MNPITVLLQAAEEVITSTIQRDSVISFPMFGENFSINPPASFNLFGREIYFYGVLIAFGFILAILWMSHNADSFGFTADDVYDLVIFLIPLSLVGARIYFVAFQWDYYSAHPSEIIAIWEGGIAIYGGVIAGVLVIFAVARAKKASFMAMLDMVCFGLVMGQIIGRWGNFMNREAFGGITDVFCRMGLTDVYGHTIYVHPTFLYESLWNLVGLCFMLWWHKSGRRSYDGQCALIYFFWYGLGRFWIEGLRTDSLYIAGTSLRVSQVLSAVICVTALVHLLIGARRKHAVTDTYVNRKLAEKAAAFTVVSAAGAEGEVPADATASQTPAASDTQAPQSPEE